MTRRWLEVAGVALVYGACVYATVRSMHMPNGPAMDFMSMPGVSVFDASADFAGMWAPMMVAMMLPPVAPLLWRSRSRERRTVTLRIALGYFAVWFGIGALVFALGRAWYYAADNIPVLVSYAGVLVALVMIGAMLVIVSERVVPWYKRLSQIVGALAMLGGVTWGIASL